MPTIEVLVPAAIGEEVLIHSDGVADRVAMVLAWRLARPRFLVGGALDGDPQLFLLVLTARGDELWLGEAEVRGFDVPSQVSVFLPFMGGDQVLVGPAQSPGEIRSWTVTGRRLRTEVRYRVHLAGTPVGDEFEVDARELAPRSRV